jgi:hypothetical protein
MDYENGCVVFNKKRYSSDKHYYALLDSYIRNHYKKGHKIYHKGFLRDTDGTVIGQCFKLA